MGGLRLCIVDDTEIGRHCRPPDARPTSDQLEPLLAVSAYIVPHDPRSTAVTSQVSDVTFTIASVPAMRCSNYYP